MGRPKTTEQNIIRTGKSEAEVTNNKRLRSRYCILLTLTSDRQEASRGLSATAGLLAVTRGRQQADREQERTEDSPAQSIHFTLLAVWLSGNTLASINVVALRQTRLVLGWVTVC